ncbi:MAG: LPS-assembly protein LptD, partial [Sphingomonadales bacterium]
MQRNIYKIAKLICFFFPIVFSISFSVFNSPVSSADFKNTKNDLELSADGLTYDPETGIVVATGNVVLSHNGYILLADLVRYNQNSGKVVAEQNIQITEPDGTVLLLDGLELNENLKEGFVKGVRLLLEDGSRLAAKDGERLEGNKTILNYAVYSPCTICKTKPNKKPLWQIKAVKVTHDQDKKRIYYKNGVLEMFGLPVAFLPYFSHPDPTVKRASGFLAPEISHKRELGLSIGLPYYHVFSSSSDITLKPIINSGEASVLAADYRKKLLNGKFNLSGSGTITDEYDNFNSRTGRNKFRGHLKSSGMLTHNKNWESNYQINWASDDTYLRRFGFSNEDTLTTKFQTQGFFGRSYIGIETLAFQGLRIEDEKGKTAFALPLINMEYVSKPNKLGVVYK